MSTNSVKCKVCTDKTLCNKCFKELKQLKTSRSVLLNFIKCKNCGDETLCDKCFDAYNKLIKINEKIFNINSLDAISERYISRLRKRSNKFRF